MNKLEISEQIKVLKTILINALNEMKVLEDELNLLLNEKEDEHAKPE